MHVDHATLVEEVVSEDLVPSCRQQQEPWYPDPPVSREVSLSAPDAVVKATCEHSADFPCEVQALQPLPPKCVTMGSTSLNSVLS